MVRHDPFFILQTFGYDYAGNMTNDSVWDYTYDAENRIVSMQTRATDVIGTGMLANSDARRLEFTYDYLGRRVQKIVRGGFNGSSYTSVVSNRKYLYDGWNLVAEFDAVSTLTLVRSYTWGLDLTGSPTASGGVGALLQVYDHSAGKTYLPTYDGNGNVVSLINADTGAVAAVYEHGPFGEPMRAEVDATALASDAALADQPFRFSTKFTDTETGLVYYGKRYYSPTLGRFINRDPIGERGGLNLYGFVANNGISNWDYLGLYRARGCGYEILTGRAGGKIVSMTFRFVCDYENNGNDRVGGGNGPKEAPDPRGGNGTGNDGSGDGDNGNDQNKTDPKQLPPCSQYLKNGLSVTEQAFIMDAKIPDIPALLQGNPGYTLKGDNRGFLDAPANGRAGQSFRLSNTGTLSSDGKNFRRFSNVNPSVEFDGVGRINDVQTATDTQRGYGGLETTGFLGLGRVVYGIHLTSRVGVPFAAPLSDVLGPIRMNVSATFDPSTGIFSGDFTTSGFPSFQLFANGESVLDVQQGKPTDILQTRKNSFSKQLCDPTK